ncbi:uncharacterized protein MYCFIDRAFT_179476 [Pseudocercospora fijiensis CIRAD86]|uniref:Uncharacterized protein n=1 Tax=Pseudocercospora fijiensis (strain CIRAD86) TaxID=383855 RepID=M3ALJ4_PSEFD|nr:uncharacterized protein MYCFIDRAFT_179476 [Pseudocercospora fijiensis CIRAD86]EME78028.1 hypothetical protein MYCFIDRAFT_179476 [Pseudocercospora fijiensis CIRAD86]
MGRVMLWEAMAASDGARYIRWSLIYKVFCSMELRSIVLILPRSADQIEIRSRDGSCRIRYQGHPGSGLLSSAFQMSKSYGDPESKGSIQSIFQLRIEALIEKQTRETGRNLKVLRDLHLRQLRLRFLKLRLDERLGSVVRNHHGCLSDFVEILSLGYVPFVMNEAILQHMIRSPVVTVRHVLTHPKFLALHACSCSTVVKRFFFSERDIEIEIGWKSCGIFVFWARDLPMPTPMRFICRRIEGIRSSTVHERRTNCQPFSRDMLFLGWRPPRRCPVELLLKVQVPGVSVVQNAKFCFGLLNPELCSITRPMQLPTMHFFIAILSTLLALVTALPVHEDTSGLNCDHGACVPDVNTAECQSRSVTSSWEEFSIMIGVVYNHGVGCNAVFQTIASKIGKPETNLCQETLCDWTCSMIAGHDMPSETQPRGGPTYDAGTSLKFYAPHGRNGTSLRNKSGASDCVSNGGQVRLLRLARDARENPGSYTPYSFPTAALVFSSPRRLLWLHCPSQSYLLFNGFQLLLKAKRSLRCCSATDAVLYGESMVRTMKKCFQGPDHQKCLHGPSGDRMSGESVAVLRPSIQIEVFWYQISTVCPFWRGRYLNRCVVLSWPMAYQLEPSLDVCPHQARGKPTATKFMLSRRRLLMPIMLFRWPEAAVNERPRILPRHMTRHKWAEV